MILVASLIVHNEAGRYLEWNVRQLATFCDRIAILDDGSTDDTAALLLRLKAEGLPITEVSAFASEFYRDESAARQRALDLAVGESASHVIVIDGDELVSGGAAVRQVIESNPRATGFTLCMEEIWKATEQGVMVRHDGGWRAHPVMVCYRVDAYERKMRSQALGGGRIPPARERGHVVRTEGRIFHMGWTRVAERAARNERYVIHDGGNFHNAAHLESIMWPDERVLLSECDWPAEFPASLISGVATFVNSE